MLTKVLLPILFILSLIFTILGQEKQHSVSETDFRSEFEAWKATGNTSKSSLFFTAEVERNDARTATIKIGIGNFGDSFQITVKPLKIEKNTDGTFQQTEMPEAATLSFNGQSKGSEFSDPTLKIFADEEANAVEIAVKINGKENGPKLTLRLSGNSKGKIVSADSQ